ncbi:MAG TPA: DUF2218 domain-containing protein [Alphaproteobacteria bacterium]|jgi:hypothetical protein|nr:DUF2218 domain-containing protein [Alphaproteobacteria bacterium]
MIQSEARVSTTRAGRYLGQLCKHFEHRIPATYTADHGRLEFAAGICHLDAAGDVLVLRAEAETEEQLSQLEGVVARHLERFAFRDKPDIRWTRGGV